MKPMPLSARILAVSIALASVACLSGCGGGGHGTNDVGGTTGGGGTGGGGTGGGGSPPPPPTIPNPLYLASAPSPFTTGCDDAPVNGDTLYVNSEVEPYVVVDPLNPQQLVGVWQEDRWEGGGARGIISGLSVDGGHTWSLQPMLFSRCGGGNSGNGGNYARTSNPWVTTGPTNVLYESAISFSGNLLATGSTSAVLASHSIDNGHSWGIPATLISDTSNFFNDRDSITADPTNANNVYAVWDRLAAAGGGPTMLGLSNDGGATWQTARPIYDPGTLNQTISNEVVVLPNGTALDMFVEIDTAADGTQTSTIKTIESTDHGTTWSTPTVVADLLSVETVDPNTGAAIRDAGIIPQMTVSPSGTLYVVWEDARFSAGARNGIALASSSDGGVTWSTPVQVNSVPTVAAFDPGIHVRSDGTIGVTYYDFRNDYSGATTLPTILWFTSSADGVTWKENAVAGPFDLDNAPNSTVSGSPGLFLGDNQGLTSIGSVFEPLFAQTNSGNLTNRTDIFSAPAVAEATDFAVMARTQATTARPAAPIQMTPYFSSRVSDSIAKAMESRLPGWGNMVQRWHAQDSDLRHP